MKCNWALCVDYQAKNASVPETVSTRFRSHSYGEDNIFSAYDDANMDKLEYDAYERDIAIVHVFFENPSSFSYVKSATLTT